MKETPFRALVRLGFGRLIEGIAPLNQNVILIECERGDFGYLRRTAACRNGISRVRARGINTGVRRIGMRVNHFPSRTIAAIRETFLAIGWPLLTNNILVSGVAYAAIPLLRELRLRGICSRAPVEAQ